MSTGEDDIEREIFTVSARRSDDGVSLALKGELDLAGEETLVASVRDVLVDRPRWLEIDGGELTFAGSSGVRALLAARSEAEHAGVRFGVVALTPPVRRVLEIVGVADLLQVDPRHSPAPDTDPPRD